VPEFGVMVATDTRAAKLLARFASTSARGFKGFLIFRRGGMTAPAGLVVADASVVRDGRVGASVRTSGSVSMSARKRRTSGKNRT